MTGWVRQIFRSFLGLAFGFNNINGPVWWISESSPCPFPTNIRSLNSKLLGRKMRRLHGMLGDRECHLWAHEFKMAMITLLNSSSFITMWRGKVREPRIQSYTELIRLDGMDWVSCRKHYLYCIGLQWYCRPERASKADQATSRHPLQTEAKYDGNTVLPDWEISPAKVERVRICSFWVRQGVDVWETHEHVLHSGFTSKDFSMIKYPLAVPVMQDAPPTLV